MTAAPVQRRREPSPLTWEIRREPDRTGLVLPDGSVKWYTEAQLAELIVVVMTDPAASELSLRIAERLAGPERWQEARETVAEGLAALLEASG